MKAAGDLSFPLLEGVFERGCTPHPAEARDEGWVVNGSALPHTISQSDVAPQGPLRHARQGQQVNLMVLDKIGLGGGRTHATPPWCKGRGGISCK